MVQLLNTGLIIVVFDPVCYNCTMIIGIDAREIQDGVFTGIGRVLHNFLRYFEKQNDEHRCVLFSEKKLPVAYIRDRINTVVRPGFPVTILWDQIVLPELITTYSVTLFYSPYYKVPLLSSVPMVNTIFDLMYIYYPTQWRGTDFLSRYYYRLLGGLMVKKVHMVFSCSHYSKTEIVRFYHIPEKKVSVIHLGLSDRYRQIKKKSTIEQVKQKYGITDPYILYTGNFKPHKNITRLISVFNRIAPSLSQYTLVLAGNTKHHFEAIAEKISESPMLSRIISTGLVSQEEQICLYNGAKVFVFPSLYEGFGYPPLEAMACGTPVVTSDRTSLKEIIGNAALVCDPTNERDMADKIILMCTNTSLRKCCISRGLARVQKFSNDHFCRQFYTMLISGGTHHYRGIQ